MHVSHVQMKSVCYFEYANLFVHCTFATILNHFHLILFFNECFANIPHLFKVFNKYAQFIYALSPALPNVTWHIFQLLNETQARCDLKCMHHLIEANICTDFPLHSVVCARAKLCINCFTRIYRVERKVHDKDNANQRQIDGFQYQKQTGCSVKGVFILPIVLSSNRLLL